MSAGALELCSTFAGGSLAVVRRRPRATARRAPVVAAQPADDRDGQQDHHRNMHEQPLQFPCDADQPVTLVQDWRSFRARMVASELGAAGIRVPGPGPLGVEERWAHTLAYPERGCLLVARQDDLGMFNNSVILLLEHDDAEGSSGLVINMPTPLLIAHLGLEEDIANAFGKCPLYVGGPITKNLLHVVHGRRDVEGSMEIMPGVYAGGVESASELVRSKEADPREFMLLAGYSGWGPYQLQQELVNGSWYVVAASHTLILDCLRDMASWYPIAPAAGGKPETSESLKCSCWQAVLDAAGIGRERV